MSPPEQLLLSDLLRRRVRCEQGVDHGNGVAGWMHPPVHRVLGWASRPSAFGSRRLVWRLDQLRCLSDQEVFVRGEPADADVATLERLPTLLGATLLGAGGVTLGTVADAAFELRTGRIRHYLVARSDPRLPGSSRWRLTPERIVDQYQGIVESALHGLDDLPLARSSVREQLLSRTRRWRDQMEREGSRLRDMVQEVGDQVEGRVEGWMEEPPWVEPRPSPERNRAADDPIWPDQDEPIEGDANEDDPDAWDRPPVAERPRGRRRQPLEARPRHGEPVDDIWQDP